MTPMIRYIGEAGTTKAFMKRLVESRHTSSERARPAYQAIRPCARRIRSTGPNVAKRHPPTADHSTHAFMRARRDELNVSWDRVGGAAAGNPGDRPVPGPRVPADQGPEAWLLTQPPSDRTAARHFADREPHGRQLRPDVGEHLPQAAQLLARPPRQRQRVEPD